MTIAKYIKKNNIDVAIMTDLKVRVESIYDLALSKLLLDQLDMTLVSPTKDQDQYLDVDTTSDPHDVHIGDLEYRTGIQVKGEASAVKDIEQLLRDNLPDSIIFKHPIQQDAIFYATVTKYIYRKRLAILDLGQDQKGIMFNVETKVGEQLLVQIKELTTEKDKLPVCSTTITLSGDYAILEVDADFVRISRKIRGEDRQRLHELGKELLPPGFGVIIRTSANSVDDEIIEKEINQLKERWEQIQDEIEYEDESNKIAAGEVVSEIILGNASKVFLDKIRRQLVKTIPNYHHFKAYSMASGFTADFAQHFVEQIDNEELANQLEKMIIQRDFPINNHVKAEFNYLNGKQSETIIGNIVQNGDVMVTQKKLDREHQEEMPNFEVAEGDVMETHFAYGTWTVHYRYYSELTNEILGEKLRIITPLDFVYRGRIRAFDMGMTLYKNAHGEITSTVDDSISDMVDQGMISKDLDNKLGEVLRVAMSMMKASDDTILIQLGQ